MKVRFLRPGDIPSLRPVLEAEVQTLPEHLEPSVEACEEAIRSLLNGVDGFGLLCLDGDDVAGVYLGRIAILPGATRAVLADVFYASRQQGAMDAIIQELEHLARLWGCAGVMLGMNRKDPVVVMRWGSQWGAHLLSTCLLKEV